MPKKKKIKKPRGKILEEPKEKNSGSQNTNAKENGLGQQLNKAVEGLYFISETDAQIEPFNGKPAVAVTKEEILSQSKNAVDSSIEEKSFAEFFTRLTQFQDWFGDEEKETAQKYARLKELLEENLKDLKVFRVGKIQLDIYVVGLDAQGNLMGIKTRAVET